MGLPVPDAPSPDVQDAGIASAGFQAGPPAASLCGFKLPIFLFSFGFKLPSIFPLPIPRFKFSIGLSCDLNNPLNVSAGISFGGGRKPTGAPNDDDDN